MRAWGCGTSRSSSCLLPPWPARRRAKPQPRDRPARRFPPSGTGTTRTTSRSTARSVASTALRRRPRNPTSVAPIRLMWRSPGRSTHTGPRLGKPCSRAAFAGSHGDGQMRSTSSSRCITASSCVMTYLTTIHRAPSSVVTVSPGSRPRWLSQVESLRPPPGRGAACRSPGGRVRSSLLPTGYADG